MCKLIAVKKGGKVAGVLEAGRQRIDPFHTNRPGFVMVLLSFTIGIGVAHLLNYQGEGLAMVVSAPLLLVMDVGYRKRCYGSEWMRRTNGGTLFYIPVFVVAAFWLVLGSYYLLTNQ